MEDLIVPERRSAKAPDSMLPRKLVVPISTVNRVVRKNLRSEYGAQLDHSREYQVTRNVIYPNSDGSKKVTITVDEYTTASDPSSAYQEAVARSKTVPASSQFPRRISVRTPLSEP
jgi:hypothetical protein